jgi:glycosyltransferase involved in cell wall biosynthesis
MINSGEISIIIPALNEAAVVGDVVASVSSILPEAEVVVVNDGSVDATAQAAEAAGARVISHDRTMGYGAALRTGIEGTVREYVLFCDADGQHTAADVLRVAEAAGAADMVVGTRDRASHVQLNRRLGKWVLRRFADFLAGERIPDLNSGLRIIRRSVILRYLHLMPRGFSFSTTSTFALLKGGYRIRWIPITVQQRTGVSTVRQWKHGPQAIMLMIRLSVLFEPLKVFLCADAVLLLLGFVSLTLDIKTAGQFAVGQTSAMLFVSALMVFLFGLLCDQVSALRREIHE